MIILENNVQRTPDKSPGKQKKEPGGGDISATAEYNIDIGYPINSQRNFQKSLLL